jgi:hypothetical protein
MTPPHASGEMINRFRRGSLVMRLPDSELSGVSTLLYGSVDGSIGLLASLPRPLFEWCKRLEQAMDKVPQGPKGSQGRQRMDHLAQVQGGVCVGPGHCACP